MNCIAVRDLLPEHALGVSGADGAAIERHLARCAACRKEARELNGAASTLAFAVGSASPRSGLEDDVVHAVQGAAGRPRRALRARRSTTMLLAAAVAALGLVGGVAIADRTPADDPIVLGAREAAAVDAIQRFRDQVLSGEGTVASTAILRSPGGAGGGGSAIAVVTPEAVDQVLIVVMGVPADARMPYTVELADGQGRFVKVGAAEVLDSGGGFTVAAETARDLGRFVNVLVRDAAGEVVIRGTLREDLPASSPSPAA